MNTRNAATSIHVLLTVNISSDTTPASSSCPKATCGASTRRKTASTAQRAIELCNPFFIACSSFSGS